MSLLLAWQVKDKHCLVIGGGDVGVSRVAHLLRANAKVTVVTGPTIDPELLALHEQGKLHKLDQRDYELADLTMYEQPAPAVAVSDLGPDHYAAIDHAVFNERFACVCCCIDDPVVSTQVYYQCKHLRIPVNIADKPPMCDFYFGLMFNQDALQIMVSTNGQSPRLLKMIKDDIARQFAGVRLQDAVAALGLVRARLRSVVPGSDLASIDARMRWIKTLTDFFSLRQWTTLAVDERAAAAIVAVYPEYPPRDFEAFQQFIAPQTTLPTQGPEAAGEGQVQEPGQVEQEPDALPEDEAEPESKVSKTEVKTES